MPKKKEVVRRKSLPHNTEAEKAVLGAMIRSKKILSDGLGALTEDDFFPENEAHRMIFAAMKRIDTRHEPVDGQTLVNELINSNQIDDVGGPEYLMELADSIVTFANISNYISIIKDQALLRNFLVKINEISEEYYTSDIDNVSAFLSNSEHELRLIAEKRKVGDFKDAKEISNSLIENINKMEEAPNQDKVTGISTGYTRLDYYTHGFQDTNFIVLAARTGVGKTAFSLNLALNAAKKGVSVAYFSLEMSSLDLFKRLASKESQVDYNALVTGYGLNKQNRLKLNEACNTLSNLKIYVDDSGNIKILELAAKIRNLINKDPDLKLVFVDHIGLVQTDLKNKDNRQQEVQIISTTLKQLALELKIVIVGVCQLNRRADEAEPQISHLRESGSIEQDADVILLLHEPKVSSENKGIEKQNNEVTKTQEEVAKKDAKNENTSMIKVIIGKNRAGSTGRFPLLFVKNNCAFYTPSEEAEDAYNKLDAERINYFKHD